MKTRKVIAWQNLPSKMPFQLTITTYLLLDKLKANDIVWGICAALIILIWLNWILACLVESSVDLKELQ